MTITDYRSAAELGQVIPVIDLADALAGDPAARAATAAEIDAVCREIGFFLISGHGVPEELVAAVQATTKAFFALPDDAKAPYASAKTAFRGWSHRDAPSPVGPVRVREQFEVSRFDTPEEILAAGFDQTWADQGEANNWPREVAAMRDAWKAYYGAVDELGNELLSLMAEALGLPSDWFVDKFDRQASYLACNQYPVPPVALEGDGLRFAAHTDVGSLTILHQDDGPGGVEVLDRLGRWCPIAARPGTYVVNLGDLLAKWTNDHWVATQHRVRDPGPEADRPRMSIPYFQHPNFDALIECLPSCTSDDEPARYPAVLAGNWTTYRFDNDYEA